MPEEPIISVAGVLQAVLGGKLVSLKLHEQLLVRCLGSALFSCGNCLETDLLLLEILEVGLNLVDQLPTFVRGGFQLQGVLVLAEGH